MPTQIKVTLECYYGTWMATARDDVGELCNARNRDKEQVKVLIAKKVALEVTGPFEIEWLDITPSAKDDE